MLAVKWGSKLLERILFQNYQIYPEFEMLIGDDIIIESEGKQYLIRPVEQNILKRLDEMVLLGEWLLYNGQHNVATIKQDRQNNASFKLDEKNYIVYTLPVNDMSGEGLLPIGRRLASFHQKGFHFPQSKTKAMNSWKERWEKRVDQLENWYGFMTQKKQKTNIDEQFCLTFPYFLGVCENAIQMLGDLFITHGTTPFMQQKTICHQRFQEITWLTLNEGEIGNVIIPTDFIFDHYVRDIADYIRALWLDQIFDERDTYIQIEKFLNEYETVYRLSLYDQKLLFIRLLFPLHYFEKMERYYETKEEREKALLSQECELIFSNLKQDFILLQYILRRYPHLQSEMQLPHWLR